MDKVIQPGRVLFGVAIAALGIEHLVLAWFRVFAAAIFAGETVMPVIPWVPAHAWLAYLTGGALLVAGLSLAANIKTRLTAILLGILFLVFVLFLEGPRLIASHFGQRTIFFEALALCASALVLAGTVPAAGRYSERSSGALDWGNESWLSKSGRFLFAISAIVFGVDHLMFIKFIASLVPPWIPWHLFWAYFTAIGFIAAGLSIGTKWLGRWSATLLGTMFLLWFLVLHLPRALGLAAAAGPGAPRNPNEWSSAFIALGMCGGSWTCARALAAKHE